MRHGFARAVVVLTVVTATAGALAPSYAGVPAAPVVPAITSSVDIGPIQQNPTVLARDNARSALFHGRSVWAFGDTPMSRAGADGDHWSDNTVSWTGDLNAADGLTGWTDVLDSAGAPAEFLPLTSAERAFNAAHAGDPCQVQPCGAELALWPGEIVADVARDRLLIFYAEIYRVSGNFTVVGYGIATWAAGEHVVRPVLSPGSKHPTLMFGAQDFGSGNGSVLVGTTLYNYGCLPEWIVTRCRLARVPIDQVLDRHAWRYYARNGTWSARLSDAVVVVDGGAAGTSVSWNPYLHAYLAVYGQNYTNDVMYRVSDSPAGPWSEPKLMVKGLAGWQDHPDYAAASHAELAMDGGRTIYVTYVRDIGLLQQEIRQVLVTFG